MDEKTMKILGGIIGGFVVFILILFMISSCGKSKYTYEKLQLKMLQVAKKYYEQNDKELPRENQDTKTYTLKKMISDGKISELSELFDDENIKCDGSVTVTNNNGRYMYSPYLSCGKDYQSIYLKDKIVEDSLVESGVGLYEVGDQYIMKGEVENNVVKFNEQLFYIMRINDDGTIRLIQKNGLKRVKWDDRYNEDKRNTTGRNEFIISNINSRIKETLDNYYNNDEVWSDDARAYIVTQNLCIGKRSDADITKDGSTECSVKLPDQTFGAISTYEYLQATLDTNCVATIDRTCKNYNWIANKLPATWTINASSENTHKAYKITDLLGQSNCSTTTNLNVVFNISDKVIYISGTGTEEDPYIFQ